MRSSVSRLSTSTVSPLLRACHGVTGLRHQRQCQVPKCCHGRTAELSSERYGKYLQGGSARIPVVCSGRQGASSPH